MIDIIPFEIYSQRLNLLKEEIMKGQKDENIQVRHIINWLEKKRQQTQVNVEMVPISKLNQWIYDEDLGIIRHKDGKDYFFSIEGISITQSRAREVLQWDQPIFNQKEGGILAILCQEHDNNIKFLLYAKYEPGNINNLQLSPTIQATNSNLKQHHGGKKPRFSEYLDHPLTTLIYKAAHNEEGGRFWKKSNVNSLLLLDKNEKIDLTEDDDYIWLSLSEIKALMLHDNIINPFVKTILSPL